MLPPASQSDDILSSLRAIVGDDHVITSRDELIEYGRDKSPFAALDALAAVQPSSVADVQAIVRTAVEHRTPLVVRGGGWSITGWPPVPRATSVILDMRALNAVIDVNTIDGTVTAQCGIILSDLEQHVEALGYEVGTVAVPVRHTTLGGVLSGVVGGGLPRDAAVDGTNAARVAGLSIVTGTGAILHTSAGGSNTFRRHAFLPDSDGPNLTGLFLGDGGSLGVKVEATLLVRPLARHVATSAWTFETPDDLLAAFDALRNMRDTPFSMLRASEEPLALSYVVRADDLHLQRLRVKVIEAAMRHSGGRLGTEPLQLSAAAMANRDAAFSERFTETSRSLIAYILPRSSFWSGYSTVKELIHSEIRGTDMQLQAFFRPHGRHGVYATMSLVYDPKVAVQVTLAAAVTTKAYELARSLGSHSEAHQGAGSKILEAGWANEYRGAVSVLKDHFDPGHVINPGLWNDKLTLEDHLP